MEKFYVVTNEDYLKELHRDEVIEKKQKRIYQRFFQSHRNKWKSLLYAWKR